MKVRYSHLPQQRGEIDGLRELLDRVAGEEVILDQELATFEGRFAQLVEGGFAIGVCSGADAIKLSLKALEVGPGDQVITAANTSLATALAVIELGARPTFVDCTETFCLDVEQVRPAVTSSTKAIIAVHHSGHVADMPNLCALAARRGIPILEDAGEAMLGAIDGRNAGTWGRAGFFSMQPFDNLGVWRDGGLIVTSELSLAEKLRDLRDHPIDNPDDAQFVGGNARLDTLRAVFGHWLLHRTEEITAARIASADYYDGQLRGIEGITLPARLSGQRAVFHRYLVLARERQALLQHCQQAGIECKVPHPTPAYRQPALGFLGHQRGVFPLTDLQAENLIAFPCHQHLSRAEQDHVIETIAAFYRGA